MSLPASWTSELTPTVRLVRFETMDVIRLCSELQKGIGPMFTCTEHGDYLRIRTPFLFPDGDCIDLFCKVDGDVITASDLADTTGWLRMQSESTRRSPKQNRLIEENMHDAQCRVLSRDASGSLSISRRVGGCGHTGCASCATGFRSGVSRIEHERSPRVY